MGHPPSCPCAVAGEAGDFVVRRLPAGPAEMDPHTVVGGADAPHECSRLLVPACVVDLTNIKISKCLVSKAVCGPQGVRSQNEGITLLFLVFSRLRR